MTIRYPNGKKYSPTQKLEVKLPKKKDLSYSNRGRTLEEEIDETNDFYRQRNIAVIHKKPVPIQIVKVEYPSRSAAVIREAYFRTPSTTDYNGVYNGYYIDFDAKETENKTSFPLKNVHPHQVSHMESSAKQKGICFLLVRFSSLERYFVVPLEMLLKAWNRMLEGGRKSIPLSEFEEQAIEIKLGLVPKLDYLKAITQLLP
ncbi:MULTISPECIES: Holliday junction resolvase RecU [unclassified Rummeliibacillus]|uniref:Holliday junction resolvase RecU n=1 Tax=unclassified Rummeliibacillus TaxID=2622809 RepID=UPI000E668FCD|nr:MULTISPECIES: Holliday junction resolvase RecU [unclassified Rummeliibacillus]RIJ65766.1 Holliday junction resolvase RecU [Rummeliibacillus sp. POC4]RPJ95706.1 Holliday junction resolvase RecU [Rummeliibacillus sp. TYF005]